MKRFIVTAVIASLISGASFAQETPTNIVSSANIVGYVQTATQASNKFEMVSLAQFSTGSNSVHIQSVFANMASLRSGRVVTNVDRLITWNGSAYTTYGLYQSNSVGPFWMAEGAAWTTPALPKNPSTATINLGKGFWYQTTNGTKTIGFSCIYTNLLQ